MNHFKLGGFPLGFWIGQQGAIYVFILPILAYCLLMEYGDKKFHLEEKNHGRDLRQKSDLMMKKPPVEVQASVEAIRYPRGSEI